MKGIHTIFTIFFSSILLQGFSQGYTYQDLYGLWLNPDRNINTIQGLGEFNYNSFGDTFESRRSLFIDKEGMKYIDGGNEFYTGSNESAINNQNTTGYIKALGGTSIYLHQEDSLRGDTLILYLKKSDDPDTTINVQVVFNGENAANFKFGDKEFIKLSRNTKPDLIDYIFQFNIDKYFPKGPFSKHRPQVKQFDHIPDVFTKKNGRFFTRDRDLVLRNADDKLIVFSEEIHEGHNIWPVAKTFQFENCWVVLTKHQNLEEFFPLKKDVFFIFRESQEGLSYHRKRLSTTSSTSVIAPAPKQLIKIENYALSAADLSQNIFKKYYLHTYKFLNFAPLYHPLDFRLNGEVQIDGQTYQLVRTYKNYGVSSQKNPHDPDNFISNSLVPPIAPHGLPATYIFEFQGSNNRFIARYMDKNLGGPIINFHYPSVYPYGSKVANYDYATIRNKFIPFNQLMLIYFYQSLMILIPTLIVVFLLFRTIIIPYRLKNRLTKIQFESVKSQLNPHFLFNSMASIQSLMNQRKTKEANRYLNELSDLLRYHLDTGAEELVPLSEELSAIEHYCELEKLRSPFELSFEIDQGIDPDRLEIPNQLLQPLVENAIKHGLRKVDNPKLRIRVQQLGKSFSILIEDNGPGISKQQEDAGSLPTLRKTHKGLGLVREKISLLKKRGIKVKFAIEDRQEGLAEIESGTRVSIELPLNL